jgi:hypothetical protein
MRKFINARRGCDDLATVQAVGRAGSFTHATPALGRVRVQDERPLLGRGLLPEHQSAGIACYAKDGDLQGMASCSMMLADTRRFSRRLANRVP